MAEMFLSDFHIHSTFSDGSLSIPEIVDLYGSQGFGAIAITDHLCEQKNFIGKAARYLGKTLTEETFDLYQEILRTERARAWNKYGMLLIPGFELTKNSLYNHRAAHVVALNVTEWIDPSADLPVLAHRIREQGGFSVAAHPLSPSPSKNLPYYLWERRAELEASFDAWEVTYGPKILQEVMETKLPKLATSDLHHPKQMAAWRTRLFCSRTAESIFGAIKRQEVEFQFYAGGIIDDRTHRLGPCLWPESLGHVANA
jgi:hypothetical protein